MAGGGITKGMNRLGDEGYVHYLECDDGFTNVHLRVRISNLIKLHTL